MVTILRPSRKSLAQQRVAGRPVRGESAFQRLERIRRETGVGSPEATAARAEMRAQELAARVRAAGKEPDIDAIRRQALAESGVRPEQVEGTSLGESVRRAEQAEASRKAAEEMRKAEEAAEQAGRERRIQEQGTGLASEQAARFTGFDITLAGLQRQAQPGKIETGLASQRLSLMAASQPPSTIPQKPKEKGETDKKAPKIDRVIPDQGILTRDTELFKPSFEKRAEAFERLRGEVERGFERQTEIFRAVPGLRGNKLLQRVARDLLEGPSFAVTAPIGLATQAIGGTDVILEGLKRDRKQTTQALKETVKEAGALTAQTVTDPEFLITTGVLGAVGAPGVIKRARTRAEIIRQPEVTTERAPITGEPVAPVQPRVTPRQIRREQKIIERAEKTLAEDGGIRSEVIGKESIETRFKGGKRETVTAPIIQEVKAPGRALIRGEGLVRSQAVTREGKPLKVKTGLLKTVELPTVEEQFRFVTQAQREKVFEPEVTGTGDRTRVRRPLQPTPQEKFLGLTKKEVETVFDIQPSLGARKPKPQRPIIIELRPKPIIKATGLVEVGGKGFKIESVGKKTRRGVVAKTRVLDIVDVGVPVAELTSVAKKTGRQGIKVKEDFPTGAKLERAVGLQEFQFEARGKVRRGLKVKKGKEVFVEGTDAIATELVFGAKRRAGILQKGVFDVERALKPELSELKIEQPKSRAAQRVPTIESKILPRIEAKAFDIFEQKRKAKVRRFSELAKEGKLRGKPGTAGEVFPQPFMFKGRLGRTKIGKSIENILTERRVQKRITQANKELFQEQSQRIREARSLQKRFRKESTIRTIEREMRRAGFGDVKAFEQARKKRRIEGKAQRAKETALFRQLKVPEEELIRVGRAQEAFQRERAERKRKGLFQDLPQARREQEAILSPQGLQQVRKRKKESLEAERKAIVGGQLGAVQALAGEQAPKKIIRVFREQRQAQLRPSQLDFLARRAAQKARMAARTARFRARQVKFRLDTEFQPRFQQATRVGTRLGLAAGQRLSSAEQQMISPITQAKQGFREDILEFPRQKIAPPLDIVVPRQAQKQRQREALALQQKAFGDFADPFAPVPPGFPTFPTTGFPKIGGRLDLELFDIGGKGKRGKLKKQLAPSLAALEFGIVAPRGKAPKFFTGIEPRPLFVRRVRKTRRRKR